MKGLARHRDDRIGSISGSDDGKVVFRCAVSAEAKHCKVVRDGSGGSPAAIEFVTTDKVP